MSPGALRIRTGGMLADVRDDVVARLLIDSGASEPALRSGEQTANVTPAIIESTIHIESP